MAATGVAFGKLNLRPGLKPRKKNPASAKIIPDFDLIG
jgi:hypothetical protein